MKKILWIFTSALFVFTMVLTTGCEDDPVDEPVIGPLLVLVDAPAQVVEGFDETVTFTVEATKGTALLNSLVITEGAINVPANRITITGISPANNPQLVTGADREGFTWEITMNVHDALDERTYTVTITDESGLNDEIQFSILVEEAGTPIDMSLAGVLWNQTGPVGLGAIDLDSGLSTGVTTPNDTLGTVPADAEIRDLGVDVTIDPSQMENWRRQIAGMNGTVVRFLEPNAIENFDFDQVNLKEEIQGAFAVASSLPNFEDIDNDGEDELVSDVVNVGDIFVVEKPGATASTFYLVRIDNIYTFDQSNADNYRISIKY